MSAIHFKHKGCASPRVPPTIIAIYSGEQPLVPGVAMRRKDWSFPGQERDVTNDQPKCRCADCGKLVGLSSANLSSATLEAL